MVLTECPVSAQDLAKGARDQVLHTAAGELWVSETRGGVPMRLSFL